MFNYIIFLLEFDLVLGVIKLICKKLCIEYKQMRIIVKMIESAMSFIGVAISHFDMIGANINMCNMILYLYSLRSCIYSFKEIKKVILEECRYN